MVYSNEMEIRYAAKVLLTSAEGEVVLVEGLSGRKNLVGGGVEDGDGNITALSREITEEIGVGSDQITDLKEVACIQGVVTPSHGRNEIARWTLYTAQLKPETQLNAKSEIVAVTTMPIDKVASYPGLISELARQAVLDILPV